MLMCTMYRTSIVGPVCACKYFKDLVHACGLRVRPLSPYVMPPP